MAQGFLRYQGDELRFTREGISEFVRLLEAGMSIPDCADYFVVDLKFLERLLKSGEQLHEAYRHATAKHKLAIREAQLSVARDNAAMAKHLGQHTLGQPEKPVAKDPSLTEKVVGGLPDWNASPEDWVAKNKPSSDAGSTIERLKKISAGTSSDSNPE
jgi:hypothetical protein